MGKVKNAFVDCVDTDTYEPELPETQETEWVAWWVQSGTNYRKSAVANTYEELRLEIYGASYPPHTATIQIMERPKVK
jgi:hypothetical protein